MSRIESIKQAIMADPQNKEYTDKGIEPLFAAQDSSYQYHRTSTWTENSGSRHLLEGIRVVTACANG